MSTSKTERHSNSSLLILPRHRPPRDISLQTILGDSRYNWSSGSHRLTSIRLLHKPFCMFEARHCEGCEAIVERRRITEVSIWLEDDVVDEKPMCNECLRESISVFVHERDAANEHDTASCTTSPSSIS